MSKLVILTVDLQEAKAAARALEDSGLVQSNFTHDTQYKACVEFLKKLRKEIERTERRPA